MTKIFCRCLARRVRVEVMHEDDRETSDRLLVFGAMFLDVLPSRRDLMFIERRLTKRLLLAPEERNFRRYPLALRETSRSAGAQVLALTADL
jgi:hypothetical protein